MSKSIIVTASALMMLGLCGFLMQPTPGFADDPPPPEKKKADPAKKGEAGPEGDLHRAYDLLRRIKSEGGDNGRGDERLRDWTDRAVKFYRQGLDALAEDRPHEAHELGVAAHDLARTVDHARNAARFEHADPDLPPPPKGTGPGGTSAQARRDLRHAYDRIVEMDDDDAPEMKYYRDGARDLYNAARRDAGEGRNDRAAELAKAAEALTHVPEHLTHATHPKPEPPKAEPPKTKARAKLKGKAEKKAPPPEPEVRKGERPEDEQLPPPIDPQD